MLNIVIDRLAQLGYEASEDEKSSLDFLISKTDKFINGYCNIEEVPTDVMLEEADYICAEYLDTKSQSGQIVDNMGAKPVASITEGDTSVSYADSGKSASAVAKETALERLKLALEPYKCMRW